MSHAVNHHTKGCMMAVHGDTIPRSGADFYDSLRGRRVVIETLGMQHIGQIATQPERFAGILEDVTTDGILIRPDSGRLTLIFKHAIMSVSEAEPMGFTPQG